MKKYKEIFTVNFVLVVLSTLTYAMSMKMGQTFFASTVVPMGFPAENVQYVTSVATLISFFTMPLVSGWIDKDKAKMVYCAAIAMMAIGGFMGCSSNVWVVVIGRVIAWVGPTWCAVVCMALLNRVVKPEMRGISMTAYSVGQTTGIMLGPIIGQLFWNVSISTFYISTAVIAICGAVIFVLVKADKAAPKSTSNAKALPENKGIWSKYEKKAIPSVVLTIISTVAGFAFTSYFLIYADRYGVTVAALCVSINSFVSLGTTLIVGPLLTKYSMKPFLSVCYFLDAAAFVLISLWPTTTGFFLTAIILGVGMGMATTVCRVYGFLGVEASRTGAASATNTAAVQIGGIISGPIVSVLYRFLGLENIFMGLSVVYVIDGLLVLFWCRRDIAKKEALQAAAAKG